MPGQRYRAARFCHLCGEPLSGRVLSNPEGLTWCVRCHTDRPHCKLCHTPLDDGAIARISAPGSGGVPLCAHCLRVTPRCQTCRAPLAQSWYTFEELAPKTPERRYCPDCVRANPRCDICRVPVQRGSVPLDDGQYRCASCTTEMVADEEAVRALYEATLALCAEVIGEPLRQKPALAVVTRLRMGEVRLKQEQRGAVSRAETTPSPHVVGFFVRTNGTATIYVERRLPRSMLIGTLAHEIGHAWQTERAPELRDPLICEGFAEWVSHHALVERDLLSLAARSTRREDIYGRGLRALLQIERDGGRAAVLEVARGRAVLPANS